ncbi:NEDD4-binding protein 1-like [Alosa sapidissima]|uniref:NEDD4-binding protein 1-like n=1 Tax=Alosa sapidissima TaxID=34773 RepID=UPI001C086F7E|nr:NEDD4-binding protein 1-like [Alosa sapidissima]
MSHGLDMFYSCFGIYRAVQHFWNKGYRNIIACVPNYRRHSPSTIHGHEYLEKLSERGLVSWAPSKYYDDRPMLEEARAKTGRIVTNDRFVDFGPEWKETKKGCIPFEFNGNHFIPFPISSEAVETSSVQPAAMSVNGANDEDLGPTSEAPDDNTHI